MASRRRRKCPCGAATGELLDKIWAFDESGAWSGDGAVSCAAWLSWRLGWTPCVAREKVRVARALVELPEMSAALSRGELSYSKVRAMTRVANPESEETLLEIARYSTAAQLEKICRLYAGAAEPMTNDVEREKRWVTSRGTGDGMVRITMQLPAGEAERVLTAMATAESGDLADGAVEIAEARLRGNAETRSPVDISVHIDAETLVGTTAETSVCVSAETSRRLLCDAGIAPILEDKDGNTLSVGRKTRTVPAAIKRALYARGPSCLFPGCENRRFLDAHHIRHWADGGETSLTNLILLCPRHHTAVHEHGFTVARSACGELTFRNPHGESIGSAELQQPRPIQTRDATITAMANVPLWDGETPQWDACVEALLPVAP